MLPGKKTAVIHPPSGHPCSLLALTKRWSPTTALHHQHIGCIGTGAAPCKQRCSRSPARVRPSRDLLLEESSATQAVISHSCRRSPSTRSTGDPELKFSYQGALEDFLIPPVAVGSDDCKNLGRTHTDWAVPFFSREGLPGGSLSETRVEEGGGGQRCPRFIVRKTLTLQREGPEDKSRGYNSTNLGSLFRAAASPPVPAQAVPRHPASCRNPDSTCTAARPRLPQPGVLLRRFGHSFAIFHAGTPPC